MLPTSPDYYILLGAVFFAFWLLRAKGAVAVWLLAAVNVACYARWGLQYALLIPIAAGSDFLIARSCAASKKPAIRRMLVAVSLTVNLGLIFLCRYAPRAGMAMPLSLSFYSFQALTYTLDVYRKDAKPIADFRRYFASVTFFPSAVAGPITRVASLAPQWNWGGAVLSAEDGGRALYLIGLGLAKKFLVADYLGHNLVDRVFDLPTLYSGGDALAAAYGYAFQLYYDFSGYSDIAIGSALLLGIRLPANFNAPYAAANIADFWRRWHITFSNWLRDYLYFALPGKRTRAMPYANLVVTMLLGGLWHGFGWTFAIWGLLHGVGLALFRLWQAFRKTRAGAGNPLGRLLTFHFVLLTWVFFRAPSVGAAVRLLEQIASGHWELQNATGAYLAVLAGAAMAHFAPDGWQDRVRKAFTASPAFVQAGALAILVVAIRRVASGSAAPFIYSKF